MRTIANPYPGGYKSLTGFRYLSPLWLARPPALLLDRIAEDGLYVLGRDYDVGLEIDGDVRAITVPMGFVTDLTSVPWWARWYVGRVGPWLEAAVVHDWLYAAWQVVGVAPDAGGRRFADDVMLLAMEAARVDVLRRLAIYGAVRIGGRRGFYGEKDPVFVDPNGRAFRAPLSLPVG